MEDLLRERIVDALRTAVPRVATVVAAPDQCWGDIATAVENAELSDEECAALLDALVAVRDRNALLLFASMFGVSELARRAPDLPADLQVWCVAEGHPAEGLGAAAQRIAGADDEEHRARERAIFRAASRGLRGHHFQGAA